MIASLFSLRAAAALASACVAFVPVRAFDNYASLYWNGGGGTWDTTNAEWTTSAALLTGLGAWNNSQNLSAKFNGAGGTVTLVDPITVAQITFETNGYTLTGSPITFATNTGFITVASGHSQTIESALGGYFFFKTGAGTLTLKGANTYTGTTMIQDGTVVLAAGSIGNSTSSNAQVVQLDTDTSAFRVEGGTFTAYAIRANKGSVTATGENAVITVNNINIGVTSGATAYLTIADGANVTALAGGTSIGGANTTGIASISGAASLFTTDSLNVGTASGSTGSFTQTGGTVAITNGLSIGGATGTGSYRLEGGTLSLGAFGTAAGSLFELAGGTVKFTKAGGGSGSGIQLRDGTTSTLNTNGYDVSLSAPFTGTGSVRKTGDGILTVTADNSGYAQNIRIEGGGVAAGSDTALGTGHLAFGANTTLQPANINGIRTVANDITVESGVTVTLNSIPSTFAYNSALTLSGDIDGAGGLNITSAYSNSGVTTLSGDNTFTGGTTLSAGILAVGSNTALGTGALTFATAGSLRASGDRSLTNAVTLNSGVSAFIDGSSNLTLSGAINGSGSLNITSTGVTTLAGDNGSFTGEINAGDQYGTAGNLHVTHAKALGATSAGTNVNWSSSLTLDNVAIGNEALVIRGSGADGSGALLGNGMSSATGDISLYGDTTLGGTGTLTLSGNISELFENTSLSKAGSGTVILSGNNSYTGFVFVDAGALTLQSSTALGGTTSYSSYVAAGASLQLQGGITITGRYLQMDGDETNGGGVLRNLSGDNAWTGTVATYGGAGIESDSGTLTLSGTVYTDSVFRLGGAGNIKISSYLDSGDLIKTGGGTLTLSNDNDYAGVTTISGGTLQVGDGGTTGSISKTVNVVNNGTLVFNRSDNLTFAKVISGTGSLVKEGAGILTLNAVNTYEGGTFIYDGLVSFTNANRFGTGKITFDGGGLRWGTSTTTDMSARFNALGENGARLDTGANNVAFATALTGEGGITKAGSGTLTLNAANSYGGTTTVSAGTLTFGTSGTLGSATADIVVSGGTLNLATKTLATGDVTISGGTLSNGTLAGASYVAQSGTVSAVLAGSASLEKTTSGTLTLSGANTFSGGAKVSEGTLSVTSAGALGTGTLTLNGGTLQVLGNSALALNRNTSVDENSTINVNRVNSNGAVTHTFGTLSIGEDTFILTRGTTGTGTGGVTFGATTLTGGATFAPDANTALNLASVAGADTDFTANGAGALNVNGALTLGTGDIVKSGTGTLTLSGTNTYGATTVNGGTLAIGGSSTLGSGSVTVNGGTLAYTNNTAGLGSRSINLSGGNFSFTSGAGAGTGSFILDDGGLIWSGTNTLDISSRVGLAGNASFDTGSNNVTFGTALTSADGITKAGSGTLTLAAGSQFSGTTTVSAGTLKTDSGLFSSSSVTLAGGATLNVAAQLSQVMNGAFNTTGSGTATFSFDRTSAGNGVTATFGALSMGSQALAITKTANVTGGGPTLYFTGTSSFLTGSTPSFATSAGTLIKLDALNGNGNGLKVDGTGDLTILGTLSGVSQIAMNSSGVLTLSGTASTYTGRTNINAGTIAAIKLADLGQASSLGAPTSATNGDIWLGYTSAGTLRYVGETNSSTNRALTLAGNNGIGSIVESSGTGTVTFTSAVKNLSTTGSRSLTLTGSNTGLNTLGGSLSNPTSSGSTSLVKSGAGTWVLSGVNTYTGTTSVNAGTLFVNGSLANTTVTVALNATLGGTGSIAGTTTIQSGGHLAPGASPGTLTFSKGLTLNTGALLDFELGTTGDLIRVSAGTLTGSATGGITINLADAGGFIDGTYTLINFSGATLSGFDAGDFTVGTGISGYTYAFAINGNLLQLTASAIPEPSACALLAGMSILSLAVIRRRHR